MVINMSFFDVLIVDLALILAPFSVLFMFKLSKSINKLEENYLLDIVCFFIFFLLIKYSNYSNNYGIIILNIPLIIAYLYKRKLAALFLSVMIIWIYYISGFNLVIVLIEYILYFLIFIFTNKKNKDIDYIFLIFLFIKGVCLTIEYYYIVENDTVYGLVQIFFSLIVFYLSGMSIIKMIDKTNEIIHFNKVMQELEKEKMLKNSLFKITHEVKNPIAVCKGYLSMMDYSNINKVKKYNGIIELELNRTLDILNNFSSYNKIKVEMDIIDFNYLVKETIDTMRHFLRNNNVKLDYFYNDEEIFINGDYERLKQVIVNIIKNATEAIKNNGIIKVNVKNNIKSVSLHIRDNGCGISQEELAKIGELFYSTKEKGCGIGVTLSKEIVRLHGGTIRYKSKEKVYTEVIIKLPKLKS